MTEQRLIDILIGLSELNFKYCRAVIKYGENPNFCSYKKVNYRFFDVFNNNFEGIIIDPLEINNIINNISNHKKEVDVYLKGSSRIKNYFY